MLSLLHAAPEQDTTPVNENADAVGGVLPNVGAVNFVDSNDIDFIEAIL